MSCEAVTYIYFSKARGIWLEAKMLPCMYGSLYRLATYMYFPLSLEAAMLPCMYFLEAVTVHVRMYFSNSRSC